MNFHLVYRKSAPAGTSPYRILDAQDRETGWLSGFLDAQRIRNLSLRSLRSYGYDLLNFVRWWCCPKCRRLSRLTCVLLLDYVRHQLQSKPQPTPQTVNHRLCVVRRLYRFHCGTEIPHGGAYVQSTHRTRSPLGYGKPGIRIAGLHLKEPRRVVVPLSAEEVSRFWGSFRSYRDLSIIALMLFNGLRCCEIIKLQCGDLRLSEGRFHVCGKGNKERVLPLSPDTSEAVQHYLEFERPSVGSPHLFLLLKGGRRGRPMTAAGLRSLFRHHRWTANVSLANPHRFWHTFGADMVRCGVSLPALMRLMGHAHIRTTMMYVNLSPEDVWRGYHRAIRNRSRLFVPKQP